MTITQTYYNHWTGEKRIVKREKFHDKAEGKHDVDLSREQFSETRPLPSDTYSDLGSAKEAKGSMLFLEDAMTVDQLMGRGNSADDVVGFFKDVIAACKKYKVTLTQKFERIARDMGA
jgi:hypothetical protein